ncbi:unnamed protein product [Periconia digitata]|uniref:Uncharacterized protein n=1 Tax=Periconia digitata TaxID=1303443 RepID=A0A9W4XUB4_9PLEO|nr:unnamed protein product [Periconia digitata]
MVFGQVHHSSELNAIHTHMQLPSTCNTMLLASLGLMLVTPVAAVNEAVSFPANNLATQPPIGTFFHICFLIGGIAVTFSSNLVGPLMGVTSVLWLMMRNDSAVDPKSAWMMFGAWLFFLVTYVMVQCRRIRNHQLYIFLTIAVSCICMCIVALNQRSSLQSGLVTVIPPCISFAAYAVAYFFPTQPREASVLAAIA